MNASTLYEYFADSAYAGGGALNGVWAHISSVLEQQHADGDVSFSTRIDIFLEVIRILLSDGRLLLSKNGTLLEGGVDEQIQSFRSSFPSSEPPVDENGGMFVWFFLGDCFGEAVWVYRLDNGSRHLEWT